MQAGSKCRAVMDFSKRFKCRCAILALTGALAAGPAQAATTTVQVTAKVAKPVTLSAKQNLDFGTIMLSTALPSHVVSVSMTGTRVCSPGLTCTGTPRQAIFNTTGFNGMVVLIFAAPSDLINASDGSRIRFTPTAPVSVLLTNSGQPGKDFSVGGSIVIPSTATEGLYSGTIEVTVDYQ